jgi:acyl-coenzyme A thioesterase PaaI-like protein
MAVNFERYFAKAQHSSFYRWLLNRGLWFKIPFNLPHKVRIMEIGDETISMELPFIRSNKNHINGIHACALATLCEYVSGLSLVRFLPADKYRIILKDIHIIYHYQAKTKVTAQFTADKMLLNEIRSELQKADAVLHSYIKFQIKVTL